MDGRSVAPGAWSFPLTASPFMGPEQFLLILLDHTLDRSLWHHDRLFDHDLVVALDVQLDSCDLATDLDF